MILSAEALVETLGSIRLSLASTSIPLMTRPKTGVLAVEVIGGHEGQKELRAAGIRLARIGHAQAAAEVQAMLGVVCSSGIV